MARDFFINGESMVYVKGRADSLIGSLTELGLTEGPIRLSINFKQKDISVDAWGDEVPVDIQMKLAWVDISMNLAHFERSVLDVCILEGLGGAPVLGTMAHAGARMGNGLPRFAAGGVNGNHFIGLNIASPVGNKPWCFLYSHLATQPMEFPLGTERSVVQVRWRAVPYTTDPWGTGLGAYGTGLWTHVLDT